MPMKTWKTYKSIYDRRIEEAPEAGLNAGVFDASVPIAFQLNREKDKDDQVQQLVAQKGAFSALALWTFVGTRVGNASVVSRAQQEQLALNEAKTAAVSRTQLDRQAKLLGSVQVAFQKHETLGSNTLTDKDWGDIIRWVLQQSKTPGIMRALQKKHAIIAKLARLEKDWKTFIPMPTPN